MTLGKDSKRILWRLRLNSPPQRVYGAWLSPEDHQRFWCERSEPMPGAGFRLHFIDGTIESCGIEASVSPAQLRLRYFGTRVQIDLEPRDNGTDLTLTVDEVATHEWSDVHAGWLNVLLPFKAWVDFGVDLRNHDPLRTWAQHYVDQ